MMDKYKTNICIIGLGPAGIGAALKFNNLNKKNVLCLDAGRRHFEKSCNIHSGGSCLKHNPCNIISGFGGSTLFGGGKLSDFPAGSGLSKILRSDILAKRYLSEGLEILNNYLNLKKFNVSSYKIKKANKFFGNKDFKYKYYDVYTYKNIFNSYDNIYKVLKSSEFKLFFESKVINIKKYNNEYVVFFKSNKNVKRVRCKNLLLGVGRLGRNLMFKINKDFKLHGKTSILDVGVRLEMPTKLISNILQYHGDLKLKFLNDVRTFCICNDGKISPYLYENMFIVDGHMSEKDHTNYTNLAILKRYKNNIPKILKIIKKKFGKKPIKQSLVNYLNVSKKQNNTKSTLNFYKKDNINLYFPKKISSQIQESVRFFSESFIDKKDWKKVNVFAPEIEYTGLKFPVNSDFSIMPGMYLIGDCIGSFRGFLQAFTSGYICAKNLVGEINGDK